MNAGQKVRNQYGKVLTIISVYDNVAVCSDGNFYHITKIFAVR